MLVLSSTDAWLIFGLIWPRMVCWLAMFVVVAEAGCCFLVVCEPLLLPAKVLLALVKGRFVWCCVMERALMSTHGGELY